MILICDDGYYNDRVRDMQWKVAYCNNEVRAERRPRISAAYDDQEEANNTKRFLCLDLHESKRYRGCNDLDLL